MIIDGANQSIIKKSYEICYALIRVGQSVQSKLFAERLEGNGLSLLEFSVKGEYGKAISVSAALEYLLRLGADAGLMSIHNSSIVCEELTNLNAAIAELMKAAKPSPINLDSVFSKLAITSDKENSHYIDSSLDKKDSPKSNNNKEAGFHEVSINHSNNPIKAAMRQSAILERIRQSGNCRLKDLQEYFKDASERTIRYDIQDLVEKGLVDRLGNGGPSTYYRAKEQFSEVTFHTA